MAETAPAVYLLYGEDEYAIAQTVAEFEKKLGDQATAEMNTTRLDSVKFNPDQLLSEACAMPFLASRRLVIINNPSARLTAETVQNRFLAQLEKIPPSTALILVEILEKERLGKKKPFLVHKAEKKELSERIWVKAYPLHKGAELTADIQQMAIKSGGQISAEAASILADLVGSDPRLAFQEVQKLLAYVNFSRRIEADDVQMLTADVNQGDIFKLVDALGNRDGRKAQSMLQRLLEYQDYREVFPMVVRQFRLLILAREIVDHGGGKDDVVRGLKLYSNPWLTDRLIPQAKRFKPQDLQRIYRRLLEVDQAVKSSQITGDLALETLVASLTVQQAGSGI
jgi:DNA polymerase III subunit delta